MADINDPTINVNIWDDAKTKSVDVLNDGSYNRLAVDAAATIVNNESPTRYQLKSDIDYTTGSSLVTGSDTTIATYTGDGVLSFIAITNPTTSNYEVAIEVDGTERLRITMSGLGSTLGLTGSTNEPIWTQTANKQFRYHPTPELGFTTSFSILARATVGSTTVYHAVLYKERV